MNALPILYSFRRCPYAMRARMALHISGTPCAIREILLRDKPAQMIAASPKGTVPVLVVPDGQVIDQSLDIMRWALSRNDPEAWLAGDQAELIARNDGTFKLHLDGYKYPGRDATDPLAHRTAGLAILVDLDLRLHDAGNLCRDTRSLTDMAIMPFVRQFAQVDRTWFDAQPLPALQHWLAQHIASPLFDQVMTRLPQWQPDDALTLLPAYSSPAAIAS